MPAGSNQLPAMRITRRQALKAAAAATVAAACRIRSTSAAAPTNSLRIAAVGVGNRGWADLEEVATARGARIVALCDVDSNFLDAARSAYPQAAAFADYRQMLDARSGEIDAVLISTPDHMHGAISLAAMSLGKHVYVQKPLAHNLAELRQMMKLAEEKKLVTQMGTQVHGEEAYRTAIEALQRGVIGKVREAHSWIGRKLPLPATKRPEKGDQPPASLDWNLWQGVAPEHAYADELYHPFNWRMWRDYGCGILGDMGCHLFDPLFSGLKLEAPIAVRSNGPANLPDTFSPDTDVTFTFAGTPYTTGKFTIRWTNGRFKPDAARAQLPADVPLPDSGSFVVGEKGMMVLPHWDMPTFYRQGEPLDVAIEPVGRINHYHEWVAACVGEGTTSTPFSYGGVVTEAVLLGTIAGNFPQTELRWDSSLMEFLPAEANQFVRREYREGWRPLGV